MGIVREDQRGRCNACKTCPLLLKGKSPLNFSAPPEADTLEDEKADDDDVQPANSANCSTLQRKKKRTLLRANKFKTEADAVAAMNENYLVSMGPEDIGELFAINADRTLSHVQKDKLATRLAKVRYEVVKDDAVSYKPVLPMWIDHEDGNLKSIVFKPGQDVEEHEHNQWVGTIEPSDGRRKIQKFLRHLWKYVCRKDTAAFKYLMKWCAWIVQHPDQHTEVAVVLISEVQGTGKSTLAQAMREIFGRPHAKMVDKKGSLVGNFTEHLERIVFIQAEEALWAGDRQAADTLKNMVTSKTMPMHPKFRKERDVDNYLNIMFCSNHEHAVQAGIRDRRFFVLDVDDAKGGNEHRRYWNALYAHLEDGGYNEFLGFLLSINLTRWHPRDLVSTEAAKHQVRQSANSIVKWFQMSVQLGVIAGNKDPKDPQAKMPLGMWHETTDLRNAYENFCKSNSPLRIEGDDFFKKLVYVCGACTRSSQGSRPRGYKVPDEDTICEKIDEMLLGKDKPADKPKGKPAAEDKKTKTKTKTKKGGADRSAG
jgi:hypothetical protein